MKVLILLVVLSLALGGCVEAVSWAAFGLYAAQDFTQFIPTPEGTSPYTKNWPGFCAMPPDTQTVRACTSALIRQGWVSVEVGPDSQWRSVAPSIDPSTGLCIRPGPQTVRPCSEVAQED